MFRASHKQWEVANLILINTSASIKFRIVEMDNWLNLNKRPCWDSIRDPFSRPRQTHETLDYATSYKWFVAIRKIMYIKSKIKHGASYKLELIIAIVW